MSKQILLSGIFYSKRFFLNIIIHFFNSLNSSKKVIVVFISLFTFSVSLFASMPENDWKLFKETNGIKIYTSTEECHDFKNGTHYEYIILKFENTTTLKKQVSWSENLYYNGICNGCDGNSDHPLFQIELTANEIIQGGCGVDNGDTYRIFSRFLNYVDKPVLTKYDFINLIITDR